MCFESLKHTIALRLVEALSYRGFLADYFAIMKKAEGLGYAEFSRRAGFSSPAFPRDVVLKKKRISSKSLPRFIAATGLKGDLATYFKCMVAQEETDLVIDGIDRSSITAYKNRLKQRIVNKYVDRSSGDDLRHNLYRVFEWPVVYASLGDEGGATLSEIAERSGLGETVVSRILKEFDIHDIASFDEASRKYRANSPHLYVSKMKDLKFFQEFYLKSLKELKTAAKDRFHDRESAFFFNSVFSVEESLMPALIRELEKTALEFVNSSERSTGNKLATLSVGFYLR